MNTESQKLTFYRGLLFGLRAAGLPEFLAEGPRFHRAFGLTLQQAVQLFDDDQFINMVDFNIDPVFGVYSEANEMLLEGEQDTVLSLANPHLRRAKFEVDEEEAREELYRLPQPEVFEKLGEFFKAALADAA